MNEFTCEECGATVAGADLPALGDAAIDHYRSEHPDLPYPDDGIRNYAEATQRLTGPKERLDTIGTVEIRRVTGAEIDDWCAFFDHDVFADNPAWAACYCAEPHVLDPAVGDVPRTWQDNRAFMVDLLRSGRCVGYLAYVDGRPAAWVNASLRSEYSLYRDGPGADPPDDDVVGISCFAVAPPYRRHGLATALLERVLAEADGREVRFVEAYPPTEPREGDPDNFRGPRSLYDERGFEPEGEKRQNTVMRRRV